MLLVSKNNEYPRFMGDLLLEAPDWKEGDDLPAGWREVQRTEPPTTAADEVFYETGPIEIDGVLYQAFEVRPMTEEEKNRRDAPVNAKAKLISLGLTDLEVDALVRGLVR